MDKVGQLNPHEVEEGPRSARGVSNPSLQSLSWHARFVGETPGDDVEGGRPRQVPGKCWSKVTPTPAPEPRLALWSTERAEVLGLERTDEAGVVLGGGAPVVGMQP